MEGEYVSWRLGMEGGGVIFRMQEGSILGVEDIGGGIERVERGEGYRLGGGVTWRSEMERVGIFWRSRGGFLFNLLRYPFIKGGYLFSKV